MPKIAYLTRRFSSRSQQTIEKANAIIAEYQAQGFTLTLRQLYYQFVARDLIPNRVREYKRLGQVVNDARLAGLIDWEAIEDRTRNLAALSHWADPSDIIGSAAASYRIDKWATQPRRVEVWIEKEALAGVFAGVCRELDVPYLSCRGYTSQSEMWGASMRLRRYVEARQEVVILHFGDHDPSGIDMTRDIRERLRVFGARLQLKRLALNMDQVDKYKPPPNPAKETDSRYQGYIARFGGESWELDALEPKMLAGLLRRQVEGLRDAGPWKSAVTEEAEDRKLLESAAGRWHELEAFLKDTED
ncbi:MAG: hypothetical protein ACRDI1_04785 [Actinomycetota bacterium]